MDFDGDGHTDLVVATGAGQSVAWSDGQGGFSMPTPLSGTAALTGLLFEDIDGDTTPDVVASAPAGSSAGGTYYLGNSSRSLATGQTFGVAGTALATRPVVGDFDADGHGDIAIPVNNGGPTLKIALSKTMSFADDGGSYALPAGCGGPTVAGGDLDDDGRRDLIMGCGAAFVTSLQLMFHTTSNAPGSLFTVGGSLPLSENGTDIVVADVNQDGHPEIIVTGTNFIHVFPGNGTQTPGGDVMSSALPLLGRIAVADFDGDGAKDLALTDYNNNRVVMMRNEGAFSFSMWGTIAVGNAPYALVAADFDEDGQPDIATANAGSGTVTVHLNRTH